jgi:hypothetical protein
LIVIANYYTDFRIRDYQHFGGYVAWEHSKPPIRKDAIAGYRFQEVAEEMDLLPTYWEVSKVKETAGRV